MLKDASINLIGLMFETYTHECQSTNHISILNDMQQDSWTSSGMELTIRRKLAGLDEALNVFHSPIYTHIILFLRFYYDSISEWCIVQSKALDGYIWEYIKRRAHTI